MQTHSHSNKTRRRPLRPRRPNRNRAQRPFRAAKSPTAWHQGTGDWYNAIVGAQGHYYHQKIVLPGVKRLLDLKAGDSLLDLACGQGVLAREIPEEVHYWGVDAAPTLIDHASARNRNRLVHFWCADVSVPFDIPQKDFSAATIVLALQNIKNGEGVIENASRYLMKNGRLAIVLNHPCFRIPRQSAWGVDELNRLQYRRVNRYLTPMEVPLQVHPSRGATSEEMWTFHQPLEYYFAALAKSGLVVRRLEEWVSDKTSTGSAAKMENRARKEFPLFLALLAEKI